MSDCVANSYNGTLGSFAANGCLYKIPGSCVFYTGVNIPSFGINNGDTLNTLITKLVDEIEGGVTEATVYTATAPLNINGSNVISISQASSISSGFLTLTDWNLFNNKVPPSRTIIAQAPLTGGGDLSVNRTIGISQATAGTDGYLIAAHWVDFNSRVVTGVNLNPSGTVKANVFKQKNGSNILEFRQLIQGANILLTETSEGIEIASTASGGGGGTVTAVTGTAHRITSTGGSAPQIDIAATYLGQTSITTLGTITTGTWQGTSIADAHIASAATWNAKQPGDPDLSQIAALTPSNGDFIERVGGVWVNRTGAQVKTDLGLAAIASSGSANDLASGTIPTARIAGSATNGFVVKLVGGVLTYQADLGSDTIRTVSSNDAVTASDRTILVNAAGGNITITVNPAINTRMVNIKKIDTSANVVTVQPSSGTIDGDASRNIEDPWTTLSFHSNGTNLYII